MSLDGKLFWKQWGLGWVFKGLDGLDLDNLEVKELLCRLKEVEESISSSSGYVKFVFLKFGEYYCGIKVDLKIFFINFFV